MGLMQRRKGRAFEQRIARLFRDRWPDAVVRRASQADGAHQSDVHISGGPAVLSTLWIECQDARSPTPAGKLGQAERDAPLGRLPVAIWHQLGARDINVTTYLFVVDQIRGATAPILGSLSVVTMRLEQFLDVLSETAGRKEAA